MCKKLWRVIAKIEPEELAVMLVTALAFLTLLDEFVAWLSAP